MATSAPAQTIVGAATGTDVRPVMLLTLNTPLDPAAVRFATADSIAPVPDAEKSSTSDSVR